MIMNYYREIDRSKYAFDFAYFEEAKDDSFYKEEIQGLGGNYYLVPKLNLTNLRLVKKSIREIFENYNYEIVHCHEVILINFIQKELRNCGVKRIIAHSHSTRLSNSTIGLIRNRLMSFGVNRYCDDIVACSYAAGSYLFGNREFRDRGRVIVNGVDTSKYLYSDSQRKMLRKHYAISDSTFVLGTVGRCEDTKNQAFIINLLNDETLKKEEIVFILVGEGLLHEKLYDKAKSYDLKNRVLFVGSQTDIRPFLCAMDLFLFPSKAEGFGVALVEAQLCKLPCVANTKVPRETRISDYVQYISIDDKQKWINAIEIALHDKSSRQKRAFDSSAIDIKNCVKALENLYENR